MKGGLKKAFFCQNCGGKFLQWKGQCPFCKDWNSLVEEIYKKEEKEAYHSNASIVALDEVDVLKEERIKSDDNEFNRTLGGGIVKGSLILVGGEPGIGKSTLFLQVALGLEKEKKVLYVSGEESNNQIRLRAKRLTKRKSSCFLLSEVSIEHILKKATELNPHLIIIDSIQTLKSALIDSSPGSVSQIRECASSLLDFSKKTNIPIILIGHITKDGMLAGPKILEHMVDVVLQFEGDRQHIYRILRTKKNRFGSISELGVYQMREDGLIQVEDPSQILICNKEIKLNGHSIAVCMEGMRPILLEVQALVGGAVYGTPQRSSTGFDLKRLHMLLAVLDKRLGMPLRIKDIFVNITGGIKIDEPAIDLSIIASIISSFKDSSIKKKSCFCAEVGLSGELRPVNRIEDRIMEAQRLGFDRIFISSYHNILLKNLNIEVIKNDTIAKMASLIF